MIIVRRICRVIAFFGLFCEFSMDLSEQIKKDEIEKLSKKIPVLSEYAASLENRVKLRYLQKISVVGVLTRSIFQVSSSIRNVYHLSNSLICLATLFFRQVTTRMNSLRISRVWKRITKLCPDLWLR